MPSFHVLPGLPPYGPTPRPFPAAWGRLGREGLVVEFEGTGTDVWMGNFVRGDGRLSSVLPHPDGRRVLVIAGGDLWVVDPHAETGDLVFPGIDAIWGAESPDGFIVS